jgi:hypothetical protein
MGMFITKWKYIFQKLTEKYDFVVVPNLAKKYILLFFKIGKSPRFINLSFPPTFFSSIDVNKFVDDWV